MVHLRSSTLQWPCRGAHRRSDRWNAFARFFRKTMPIAVAIFLEFGVDNQHSGIHRLSSEYSMRISILLLASALAGCETPARFQETPIGIQVSPDSIIIDQFVPPAVYSDRTCYDLGHQFAARKEKLDQIHEQLQQRADKRLRENYSATRLYINLKSELEALEYVIRDKRC